MEKNLQFLGERAYLRLSKTIVQKFNTTIILCFYIPTVRKLVLTSHIPNPTGIKKIYKKKIINTNNSIDITDIFYGNNIPLDVWKTLQTVSQRIVGNDKTRIIDIPLPPSKLTRLFRKIMYQFTGKNV